MMVDNMIGDNMSQTSDRDGVEGSLDASDEVIKGSHYETRQV